MGREACTVIEGGRKGGSEAVEEKGGRGRQIEREGAVREAVRQGRRRVGEGGS